MFKIEFVRLFNSATGKTVYEDGFYAPDWLNATPPEAFPSELEATVWLQANVKGPDCDGTDAEWDIVESDEEGAYWVTIEIPARHAKIGETLAMSFANPKY